MLRKLTPTVLALAVGASSLTGATIAERGEHLEAIKILADQGLRLPAERLAAAFVKANYPDEGQAKAAVEYYMADVFRSTAPAPKNGEYEAAYARLQPQIDKLLEDSKTPADVKRLLGGGGGNATLLRLVSSVLRSDLINPNQPPPLVPLTDEKIEQINRSVKGIIDVAKKDFEAAKKKVAAHKEREEKVWDLAEGSPEADKINQDAVELRIEAMRPLYFAHMALREIATRGESFTNQDGTKRVDPAPAVDFLKTLLAAEKDNLEKWDYEFSDYHILLKLYLATIFGEGARLGVTGYGVEDAEGHFVNQSLIDRDLTAFKDSKTRDAVGKLALKGWTHLLRWQLEQGSKRSLERGFENWREFQTRAKNDKSLSLTTSDEDRAATLGELWITAGRLLAARGDAAGAAALWSEVIAAKNPHSGNAKRWLTKGVGGGSGSGGDAWSAHPTASDPGASLTGAKAYLGEARNANPTQQRQYYLNAAIALRSAVLGLGTSAYADQFVDTAPGVYYFYAMALMRLDMPYHAAVAAHDGLRALTARITDKANPWKDAKTGEWTKNGQLVRNLAQNGLAYASTLKGFAKGRGTESLYADISKMATKIDPDLEGVGAYIIEIKNLFADERYEEGIEKAREGSKKFTDHYFKMFGLITDGRLRWAQKLKEQLTKDPKDAAAKAKIEQLVTDVTKSTEAVEAKAAKDLEAEKDPAKRKELENALKTCVSARISLLLHGGKHDEVLKQLGPDYWKKPPADRDMAAQMLRYLAQAVQESQNEIAKSGDLARLQAAWPACREASAVFKKQAGKLEEGEGIDLKSAATRLALGYQKASDTARKLKDETIDEEARRAFAETLGPRLDGSSKPATIRYVADTLWSLDDRAGGARLYEVYKKSLDAHADLQAYLKDPAATVDAYAAVLAARAEFKKPWDELRDLLVDKPGFLTDFKNAENPAMLGEKKRDFIDAQTKVEGFKKLLVTQKGHMAADQVKTMEESLKKLGELVDMLATNIRVSTRLAEYYLSAGRAAEAIPLGEWLYNDYDPRDPQYAKIFVEGVLQAVKKGEEAPPKAIEEARSIALQNVELVERLAAHRDTYWMSVIQVLELSAALKDIKRMEEYLSYLQRNKSTPRDDLILPPQPGDDPKVRRARDALAAELSERYLRVFEHVPGVKPGFKVVRLKAGGKEVPVFLDADAPPHVAKVETDEDGEERIVVVPGGAAAQEGE